MRLCFASTILAVVFTFGAAQLHHSFMDDLHRHKSHGSSRKNLKKLANVDKFKEQWFTQYLNHFNHANQRTWKQRYFVNDKYYEPNGPVFLFIGDEASINVEWIKQGQMFENAKHFGGKMFILEHRFYGKSQPTANLSTENLAFLNIQQALLDTAYFIEGMNEAHRLPNGTKWILFGGSYAGSLAAWMRAKYPHLVHGAVSSSGPVIAKVDWPEYFEVAYESIRSHSQACVDIVSNATKQIDEMVQTAIGRKKLKKQFKLCDPIEQENKKDLANLHMNIVSPLILAAQYHFKYLIRNKVKLRVDDYCDILVDEKRGDPVDCLAAMYLLANKIRDDNHFCKALKYEDFIQYPRNVMPEPYGIGFRQFSYQKCTELGHFQTTTTTTALGGDDFTVDFSLQMCADIFGPRFANLTSSGVERTNIIFGGLDLVNQVSNVVFVQGSADPWYTRGITKSSNPKAPAIFIKGAGHCENLFPTKELEYLPQIVQANKQVTQFIGQWLHED